MITVIDVIIILERDLFIIDIWNTFQF